MKKALIVLTTGLLTAALHAGFEIPRSVFKTDQLEQARAEAAEKNKALAFVLSDPGTSCGLCIGATDTAFEKLKSHSVIVFMNSKDDNRWNHVSPMVVTGLSEKTMGNTIPKAVVTSPDMSEIWAQMSYAKLKDESAYRDVKKQVDAILKGGEKPQNPPDRVIYWPLKGKNAFYIGSFEGLGEKGLRLKMQDTGKVSTIPLDRLTEHCAALARTLAGGGTAVTSPQASASEPPALEPWTGSNGKTLQARFVSLVDDKVTLEMEDGKTHTMPLDRLAGASRERAKELQSAKQR